MAIGLSSSEYSSQCMRRKKREWIVKDRSKQSERGELKEKDAQEDRGRTGGSRRGEATQGRALMDDHGDVYDKTQILSQ